MSWSRFFWTIAFKVHTGRPNSPKSCTGVGRSWVAKARNNKCSRSLWSLLHLHNFLVIVALINDDGSVSHTGDDWVTLARLNWMLLLLSMTDDQISLLKSVNKPL